MIFSALVDLSQAHNDELKPIDVYAIGFEEMVDLDAKNIMNARFVSLSPFQINVILLHPILNNKEYDCA